ncbi:MAG TPA: hypothetical protein PLM75_07610 [bacterium]|nr:hypothetical protein [bacterium]
MKENINDKIKKIKIFNNYMILETADNFEISNMLFEKKLNVYIIDFELIKREAIKEHNDYLKDYALSRNLKLTDLSKIYDLEFEKIEDKKLKEKILN